MSGLWTSYHIQERVVQGGTSIVCTWKILLPWAQTQSSIDYESKLFYQASSILLLTGNPGHERIHLPIDLPAMLDKFRYLTGLYFKIYTAIENETYLQPKPNSLGVHWTTNVPPKASQHIRTEMDSTPSSETTGSIDSDVDELCAILQKVYSCSCKSK